jgi:hypothetical protein
MRVRNHAALTITELAEIEVELSELETLADLVRWGATQPAGRVSPRIITEVVVQDEFTHDVIVPWGDRLILVYGTT